MRWGGKELRVRHLAKERKTEKTTTPWSSNDIPPRHHPLYPKTYKITSGWKWRSLKAEGTSGANYILVALCNPTRDNWKATLFLETESGSSVVGRFEDHGSHRGVHVHAHCERGGLEVGPTGMDNLLRIPPVDKHRQRAIKAWTEASFWDAARSFFRVQDDLPLFNATSHGP
jgi:hypothetical protein